jgi:hypothetical protein
MEAPFKCGAHHPEGLGVCAREPGHDGAHGFADFAGSGDFVRWTEEARGSG